MQLRDKLIEYKEVYTPTSESNLDSSFFFFYKINYKFISNSTPRYIFTQGK